MLIAMVISFIGTFLCAYAFRKTTNILALYMCIIFGTVATHFLIMHISAPIVFLIFKKKFNYNSFWFIPKKFENDLYRILKVKKWKTKVPTYDADEYSLKFHTVEDVAKARIKDISSDILVDTYDLFLDEKNVTMNVHLS